MAEIPGLTEGSVTLDATASIRGQCDLIFSDVSLIPTVPSDPLAPFGQELKLTRGIRLGDGAEREVSLGIFRIQDDDVPDEPDGVTVRVTGYDRAKRIEDAKFEGAYQIASGTDYLSALRDTIIQAFPAVDFDFPELDLETPLLSAQEGDDRWGFCQDMAAAIGMDLYFDGEGILVLRPVPSAELGTPAAELVEGDGGLLLRSQVNWSRENTFNKVIYTGENTDATPVRAEALDNNPASPTYYYGPFGRVPVFKTSSFITTTDQAQQAANGELARGTGISKRISFGAVVNPSLVPGTTVRIRRERLGLDETHILDAVTLPLKAEEGMTGSTRATLVR